MRFSNIHMHIDTHIHVTYINEDRSEVYVQVIYWWKRIVYGNYHAGNNNISINSFLEICKNSFNLSKNQLLMVIM